MSKNKIDKNDGKIEIPMPEHRNSEGQDMPGINTPGIVPPAFNPPVPNRAWTAMRNGVDIEELSPEERRDLYLGRDNLV